MGCNSSSGQLNIMILRQPHTAHPLLVFYQNAIFAAKTKNQLNRVMRRIAGANITTTQRECLDTYLNIAVSTAIKVKGAAFFLQSKN